MTLMIVFQSIAAVIVFLAIYAYIKTSPERRFGQLPPVPALNTADCCKNCASNKIIRGRLGASGESGGIALYSSELKTFVFTSTQQPFSGLERNDFDFCTHCGYISGFADISSLEASLQKYGKAELLARLKTQDI